MQSPSSTLYIIWVKLYVKLLTSISSAWSSQTPCHSYWQCLNILDFNQWKLFSNIWNILPVCIKNTISSESYDYWTVHHLDSWIKIDEPDVTCFIISLFNAQHVSDVNTSIVRSLRLICWVISWVVLFKYDVCWCYGVVWLGWCGVSMQADAVLQPASGYHTTPAKPQRNTNTHRTRAIQHMK